MELAIGTSINIRAKIEELFFITTAEKLLINPSKEEDELFKLADTAASDLYKTLPHTPIEAIGHNFSYTLEEDEAFPIDLDSQFSNCKDSYKNIDAMIGPTSSIKQALLLKDDAHVILYITYTITKEKSILSMNYHYKVDNDCDKIKHALSKFFINYQHSKLTNTKLITKENK